MNYSYLAIEIQNSTQYTWMASVGNYTLYSKGITDLHASGGTLSLESRALASDERLSVPPRACKSVIPFE